MNTSNHQAIKERFELHLLDIKQKLKEMTSFAEVLDEPIYVLREIISMRRSASSVGSYLGLERASEKAAQNEKGEENNG